jgi:transcriptional regulator with XRE-family HTH domain
MHSKRLDRGLSRREVSKQLGVDETSVSNWETNRCVPAIRLIPNIVRFLGYVPYPAGKSLPERLAVSRRSLGLSQKRLAKILGADESSLRSWESGRRRPSRRCLLTIETWLKGGAKINQRT